MKNQVYNPAATPAETDPLSLHLDTANGPLTGDLGITKSTPKITLNDSGTSRYVYLNKNATNDTASLVNRTVSTPASYALDFTKANGIIAPYNYGTVYTWTTWLWKKATTEQELFADTAGNKYMVDFYTTDIYHNGSGGFVSVPSPFLGGKWEMLTITRDHQTIKFYYNGAQTGATKTSGADGDWDSITNIGHASYGMVGSLDETAIWTRVLTDAEILDLYASGSGLYIDPAHTFPSTGTSMDTNLINLWHYDEGVGNTAVDSKSANNATLSNHTWISGLVVDAPVEGNETVLESKSSTAGSGETSINTFGSNGGRTVLNGKTLRFDIAGTEKFATDANGNLVFPDNRKMYFGTGSDASIYYDGSNMYINPAEVGTGTLTLGDITAGKLTILSPGGVDTVIDDYSIKVGQAAPGGYGYITSDGMIGLSFRWGSTAGAGVSMAMSSFIPTSDLGFSLGEGYYRWNGIYSKNISDNATLVNITSDLVVNTNTILTDNANKAISFQGATAAGNINFYGIASGGGGGSINFRPGANGQILFDGQSNPADPSNFSVQNRESHKMYYGTGGTTGTIPASMSLTNVYQYTEFWPQAYSGTQTSLTLYGQYVNNTWRTPVSFTTGKAGSGVKLNGSFFTSSFNADVTFTHNNSGKIMNCEVLGAQYDVSSAANLTQTAGALNLNVNGLYARINASGTGTVTGSPTITAIGLKVENNGVNTSGGTPTKNYYSIYSNAVSGTTAYGIYQGAVTGASGGTAMGLYLGAVTGGTTNWAIASDGGDSYHVGNSRFGGNTAPTCAVDATGSINASVGYQVGTVAGFTGTGAYTNFTIVGGIITAAS